MQFHNFVCCTQAFLNLGSYDPAKRIIGKLLSQGPHKKCCHFNYKKKNHKNNHPEIVHRATQEAETNFVTRMQVLLTLMYNCCNFYIDGLICCVAMVKLCCSFKVKGSIATMAIYWDFHLSPAQALPLHVDLSVEWMLVGSVTFLSTALLSLTCCNHLPLCILPVATIFHSVVVQQVLRINRASSRSLTGFCKQSISLSVLLLKGCEEDQ